MEESNATPDGGASTLDRIQAMLSGSEPESQPVESTEEPEKQEVEPDEGGDEQADQPQLSTSDLAKYLGVDETVLDLDEDGTVKFKTKIDGAEGAAKLAEMLKSYQLEGHVNKKSMELAEREKAIQTRMQEVEQQVQHRLQYTENLTNIAATELLKEYQSIDWRSLEAQDPGQAALLRQKFQERQAQLRGVLANVEAQKHEAVRKAQAQMHETLQKEAQRVLELIPAWKDPAVANKERAELRDWGLSQGFTPEEMDSVSKASVVMLLRKAMLHDKQMQAKPQIENRVRQAPKLVKPGAPAQNTKEQSLRNLKQSIVKSGGKKGIAEYLLASGKV